MRLQFILLVLIHIGVCSTVTKREQNVDSPIIGVLAQEYFYPAPGQNAYIAASYVKFLESAGARVVPVMINRPVEEYKTLFKSLNGILFPGGGVSLLSSGYAKAARIFYKLAMEANANGDYFPVWGTCLGFQQLTVLTSGERLLSRTNTSGVSLPLIFTKEANDSRMFIDFPADLMSSLASEPITANSHHWSLTVESFNKNNALQKFYKVLSTNVDGEVEFVSTMEAYDFPVYAIQWHPEKTAFEWALSWIPHQPNAIRTMFHLGLFFISEAKKSPHSFASVEEEKKYLIYNYSPKYSGHKTGFEQIYFFD